VKKGLVLLALCLAVASPLLPQKKEAEQLDNSATVLRELLVGSSRLPTDILKQAVCVVIFPSAKKVAVGIGGSYGRGVLVCRKGLEMNGAWGAPAMYKLDQGSIGVQLGSTATDFVLVVMNKTGAEQILNGRAKLGSNIAAAAGPTGAQATGYDAASMHVDVLIYSRSKGLFAGVSLEGTTMDSDDDANKSLYGKSISAEDIALNHAVSPPKSASRLLSILSGEWGEAGRTSSGSGHAKYNIEQVFYATDRNFTGLQDTERMYGTERSDDVLSMGTIKVSIPFGHKTSVLERPSWFWREDPEKYVVVLSISPEGQSTFFNLLDSKVDQSTRHDAFVFIHGYETSFTDAARRTAQLAYDLNFDGAPIFYSWPSKASLRDYPKDEATIEWTTLHLKKFLEVLSSDPHIRTIHLIAHSMGARALTAALDSIVNDHSVKPHMFREVFLAAPDIDAGVFNQLAQKFPSAADRVTLYASSKDEALSQSKGIHGERRAGDTDGGVTVVPGVDTIDATAVDTSFIGHSYYAENRSILADIFYLMDRDIPPSRRFGMKPNNRRNATYWIFKP
jgi:esterase/lipase superfamily enzyme/lipid-binding SYLF domain-containing protein